MFIKMNNKKDKYKKKIVDQENKYDELKQKYDDIKKKHVYC